MLCTGERNRIPIGHAERAPVRVQIGVHLLRGRVQRVARGATESPRTPSSPDSCWYAFPGQTPLWPAVVIPLASEVVAGFEDRYIKPRSDRILRGNQGRPAPRRRSPPALPRIVTPPAYRRRIRVGWPARTWML